MSEYTPYNKQALVESANAHLSKFEAAGEFAGITANQIARLKADRDASAAANTQQATAAVASKDATGVANGASAKLRETMLSISAAVQAEARLSADPASVYRLAGLAPRATPEPAPGPAVPENLKTSLRSDGSVSLTWTASRANTAFTVQRLLMAAGEPAGSWVVLPFVGQKPFVDPTVPLGTREVQYQVRATRGGVTSQWSESTGLRFGNGGAGAASTLKIAA